MTHVVTRMCLGCRGRSTVSELLRVARDPHDNEAVVIVADPHRRMGGRGAWIHPDQSCLTAAVRRRAFGRAFRVSTSVDSAAIGRYVEALAHPSQQLPSRSSALTPASADSRE